MPIATNALYRIDLFQTYLNQVCLNTFWYTENNNQNEESQRLGDAFNLNIMPAIAAIQNAAVAYNDIRVSAVFGNQLEVSVIPTVPNGSVSGDGMSTFVAASIRLNRSSKELRSGWKRFTGLVEQNTGALSFAGGFVADLTTLGALLAGQLSSVGAVFTPVIVRKPFSTKFPDPNWYQSPVGGFTIQNRPTTQNSRKSF